MSGRGNGCFLNLVITVRGRMRKITGGGWYAVRAEPPPVAIATEEVVGGLNPPV